MFLKLIFNYYKLCFKFKIFCPKLASNQRYLFYVFFTNQYIVYILPSKPTIFLLRFLPE